MKQSEQPLLRAAGRRGREAFSLVEAILAVMLIGILLYALASSLGWVTQQRNRVRCLANLRQISILMSHYLADHRQTYPFCVEHDEETGRSTYWPEKLIRHSGENSLLTAWICPGVRKSELRRELADLTGGYAYVSYGINRYGVAPNDTDSVDGEQGMHPAVQTSIAEPSQLLMMVEMEHHRQPSDGWYWSDPSILKESWQALVRRHGIVHALYCDGHVSAISFEDATTPSGRAMPWGRREYTHYH